MCNPIQFLRKRAFIRFYYNIASAYTLDKRNGVSYCIVNLDYSSNRTVGKMVNSILDTKLALIDRGFGGIELNYKEDALGKIYFDAENPSDKGNKFLGRIG